MASNGTQSGFEDAPAFPEEDAPALGADLEELAQYIVKRGNAFKGSTAQRTGFAAAAKGHLWYDTTLDVLFAYNGAGWVQVWAPPVRANAALASNWSVYAGETPQFERSNGYVSAWGRATGSAAAGTTIFTLPVGSRPPSVMVFQAHSDGGTQTLLAEPSGNVVCATNIGALRQGVSLAAIRFPVS